MKKFRIKFNHTVEETFTAIVEAETKEQALEIFDDSPFDYLEDDEPSNTQGLRVDILGTEEL